MCIYTHGHTQMKISAFVVTCSHLSTYIVISLEHLLTSGSPRGHFFPPGVTMWAPLKRCQPISCQKLCFCQCNHSSGQFQKNGCINKGKALETKRQIAHIQSRSLFAIRGAATIKADVPFLSSISSNNTATIQQTVVRVVSWVCCLYNCLS